MRVKFILTPLLLGITATTFSHTSTSLMDFSGYYIGAQAGVGIGSFQYDIQNLQTIQFIKPLSDTTTFTGENAMALVYNPTAALHFGYGWQWNRFYLGFDFRGAYQYFNISQNSNNSRKPTTSQGTAYNTQVKAKLSMEYGGSLRPGVLLSPNVLLFVNLGGVSSAFSMNTYATNSFAISTPEQLTQSANRNTYIGGGRIGVGIESRQKNNISLGFEYDYTIYGRYILTGTAKGSPRIGTITNSTTVIPSVQSLLFDVNYYFNGHHALAHMDSTDNAAFTQTLYLGAQGGISNNIIQHSLNSRTQLLPVNALIILKSNGYTEKMGPIGGVQFGYDWLVNRAYLAAEGHANISQITSNYRSFAGSTGLQTSLFNSNNYLKFQNDFGADFKPGYLLAPNVLLYARIGGVVSQATINSVFYGLTPTSLTKTQVTSATRNSNLFGMRAGLGIETKINRHVGLGFDYLYYYYEKLSLSSDQQIPPRSSKIPFATVYNNNIKITPQAQTYLVNLIFYLP